MRSMRRVRNFSEKEETVPRFESPQSQRTTYLKRKGIALGEALEVAIAKRVGRIRASQGNQKIMKVATLRGLRLSLKINHLK